jgi:hypothetical protein
MTEEIVRKPTDRYKDITGQRFGLLVAISHTGTSEKWASALWLCRCDCGVEKVIPYHNLRDGCTRSCGHLAQEARTKHGMSRSPEYHAWASMKQRCCKKTACQWKDYGARGIRVCARWLEGFGNFFQDMGERPSARHSLEREKVNGHYSCGHCEECQREGWPANCRWATPLDQGRNRRNTRFLTHDGETLPLSQWAERIGTTTNTLAQRVECYGVSDAITKPIKPSYRQKLVLSDVAEVTGRTLEEVEEWVTARTVIVELCNEVRRLKTALNEKT